MSTTTPNFALIKPALTDAADITAMNPNWDVIDEALNSTIVKEITANTNLNTITTPGRYRCQMSSTAATLTNCPTDDAFLLEVGQHHGCYHRIVEYRTANPKIYFRNMYQDSWGSWYREYTTADKPTPEEIGAMSASGGGTLSGDLTIQTPTPTFELNDSESSGATRIVKNSTATTDAGTYISDISGVDGTRDVLVLHREGDLADKIYIRVDSEDGSTFTKYNLYGEHNTHVGLRTYSSLADIGVAVGSETIDAIGNNLPNNSILVYGVTTSNASIYPTQYGTVTVKRSSATRIEFNFVSTAAVEYDAYLSITSSGNTWTGWMKNYTNNDFILSTTDITAGTTALLDGKMYLVYE